MKNQHKEKSHEEQIQDQMDLAGRDVDFKNAADKEFCRFTMFVKLAPGQISYWPNRQRVWCHKGNKYAGSNESRQIRKLIGHAKNNLHKYCIIELYDNALGKDNEKRTILDYKDGMIIKPLPPSYQASLKGYELPKLFK